MTQYILMKILPSIAHYATSNIFIAILDLVTVSCFLGLRSAALVLVTVVSYTDQIISVGEALVTASSWHEQTLTAAVQFAAALLEPTLEYFP